MAFPRTVLPETITRPWLPGAMKDISHSGGIQLRTTKQVGWTWEEAWGLLRVTDANHEALMTTIDYMWNRGIVDTVTHPLVPGSGLDPNGAGGGSPLVNVGSQTGGSIDTDGWTPNITNVVRAGDVLKFVGDNGVYRVRSDHNSNGSGEATINIVPNLRLSPANETAITRTGVTFRVVVMSRSRFEGSEAPSYFAGMSVVFGEMLL